MHILVINSGSSSIKFKLYEAESELLLMSGTVGRIGEDGSYIQCKTQSGELLNGQLIPDHAAGLEAIMAALVGKPFGVLNSLDDISAVGHRAVHGGSLFTGSVVVDDEVIAKLEECSPLAPLHNPANLMGILEARRLLPGVPQVAVFDTAFHQTMPPQAYLYALPYEYYEQHKVRRYGFHGSSYRFVSSRVAEIIGRPIEDVRMVVCHLGNGASMAAIVGGQSVDTTMGLTPLEGLMMGTRSGDIDPGIIFYLQRHLGMGMDEIDDLLNRRSGFAGISGAGNDLRDIEQRAGEGDERCRLAIDMYCYRIRKYIGAYAAVMGGIDALVFTGGVGENSSVVRERVCGGLEFLGIRVDGQANADSHSGERAIDGGGVSAVRVLVVPTDEEIVIVRDTMTLTRGEVAQTVGVVGE
jgi:acetate kinase